MLPRIKAVDFSDLVVGECRCRCFKLFLRNNLLKRQYEVFAGRTKQLLLLLLAIGGLLSRWPKKKNVSKCEPQL